MARMRGLIVAESQFFAATHQSQVLPTGLVRCICHVRGSAVGTISAMARTGKSNSKPELSELLLGIQAMALDASAWEPTVRKLAEHFGAERALFFSPSPYASQLPGVALELDPEILREYAAHWHQYDIWTHRADALGLLTQLEVMLADDLVPHGDFMQSTVYNECLRRNGVARLMTAAVIPTRRIGEPSHMVGAFYRSAERPAFSEHERRQYAALLPHLSLALKIYARLAHLQASLQLWQWSAERMADAMLFLAEDGRVMHMTPSAAERLCHSDCVGLQGGRLVGRGPACNRERLTAALGAATNGPAAQVMLVDRAGRPGLALTVTRVPSHLAEATPGPRLGFLVLLATARQAPDSVASSAREHYKLTATEARVLERLLHGQSPSKIASDLGVALSTVRTHLKRLYAKTGTTAQRELLAEVSSMRGH